MGKEGKRDKAEKDVDTSELGAPEMALYPLLFLFCATLSLWTFNNILRLLGDVYSKSFAKKGDWQKLVQSVRPRSSSIRAFCSTWSSLDTSA